MGRSHRCREREKRHATGNRMSSVQKYIVGGLSYKIRFADKPDDESLIPSSKGFIADTDSGPSLFELTVKRHAEEYGGNEIGAFASEAANFRISLTNDGNYQIAITETNGNKCCLMHTDKRFSKAEVSLYGDQRARKFGLDNAIMLMYAFASADKKTLLIHASCVCKAHTGYLFLGKSGTGKSTHAQLWLKHIPDTELINDDNPIVRIINGKVYIYGSPWSGKTACYRNVRTNAGAFLQLEQAKHNDICRQTTIEAFTSILSSCSVIKWDKRIYGGICDTIEEIMASIPCFRLKCLPDKDAAYISYKTIAR